jgi:glycosyltransferase involved in cell wall biosynthesis
MERVSVVVPAHNAGPFLAQALASVVGQTYPAAEIIVVNDGSTDGTSAVARRFGSAAVLIETPVARGPSAARNAAIQRASGDVIAFLDADDVWEPHKLERLLPACRRGAALVCCDARLLDERGLQATTLLADRLATLPRELGPVERPFERLIGDNFVITSTAMVTRDALARAGDFDTSLRSVEDRDLWIRVAAIGPVWFSGEPLVIKRAHAAGISRDHALAARSRLRVMRKVRVSHPERVRAMGALWRRYLAAALLDAGYGCRMEGRRGEACVRYLESFLAQPRLGPLRGIVGALAGRSLRARGG